MPVKELLGVTFRDTLDTSFKPPCTLILDQSTYSGFSLWDANKSLVMFGALNRSAGMDVTEYKFRMIQEIQAMKEQFTITQILYEDIYLQHQATYDRLIYIKHALEDLAYTESELKVAGVASSKWKSILARPNKFVAENHKAEVQKYVQKAMPLLFSGLYTQQITEDMVDALGMGIALMLKQGRTTSLETALKFNKKLPIHLLVLADTQTELTEQLLSTRKLRFKNAYKQDGLFILDSTKHLNTYNGFRQFLTHREGVAAMKVTKNHKEWGFHMLEQNLDYTDLQNENGEFWLLAVRKTRK